MTSTTPGLAMAVDEYGSNNVVALNMLYGQKHDKEIESAKAVAKWYGVPYYEMDMSAGNAVQRLPSPEAQPQGIKHESYSDQLMEMGGKGTVGHLCAVP